METFDIILDSDSEFINSGGDFKSGLNDNNLIYYAIVSKPGDEKEFPLKGSGAEKYLLGKSDAQIIKRDFISQLTADVFTKPQVDVSEFPKININKIEITLES